MWIFLDFIQCCLRAQKTKNTNLTSLHSILYSKFSVKNEKWNLCSVKCSTTLFENWNDIINLMKQQLNIQWNVYQMSQMGFSAIHHKKQRELKIDVIRSDGIVFISFHFSLSSLLHVPMPFSLSVMYFLYF